MSDLPEQPSAGGKPGGSGFWSELLRLAAQAIFGGGWPFVRLIIFLLALAVLFVAARGLPG